MSRSLGLVVTLGAVAMLVGPPALTAQQSADGSADGAREDETGETGAAGRGQVWVVDLDGAVGPASADLIIRSIEDAAEAGARALVIRMDTPGGLDKSMRDLVKEILGAPIPVITYVAPDGARAASAGTYIAYASHITAMAPATNIGSSTPVSMAPGPGPGSPAPGRPGVPPSGGEEGDETADDGSAESGGEAPPQSSDAMTRKVINDAVAYLQGLAELRGRNVEWAEETVRYGANLRASEALEKNVIDLIAPDLRTLLENIDGTSVTLNDRTVTLNVADAGIRRVETDWQHDLLTIITDPTIAYGLLIFGIYGLILEFYNPGMVFPSVIGIVCLLLGAYGLQMLPINYAGLALIVVGIGLMVAEVFTPTFGIMGVAGLVSFVMGSVILMDTEAPGYQVPFLVIGAFAFATAALTMFTIGAAVQARRRPITTGEEGMIGARARALEDFDEAGPVFAFGERWKAECDAPVHKGDRLKVTGVDGLTLKVTAE
ncbi:MAG: nodulation protein NfeD [Gammaproteobacteria bacterium]|nr:nodulation protein NfeD [Gammaproteobacteria bacterium]